MLGHHQEPGLPLDYLSTLLGFPIAWLTWLNSTLNGVDKERDHWETTMDPEMLAEQANTQRPSSPESLSAVIYSSSRRQNLCRPVSWQSRAGTEVRTDH